MIRRAAATGALAWTAPAIIDSLASPAAAASLSGCYRAEFVLDATSGCGTYVRVTAGEGTGCAPSYWNNVPEYPGTLTVNGASHPPGSPCVYTVSLGGSSGCTIDIRSVARADHANICVTGTIATDCQKLFFTPGFQPDRFKIVIACGGTVCPGGVACA
jgi:hypothetical protein